MLQYIVNNEQVPINLKQFLIQQGCSKTFWRKIKRTALIYINHKPAEFNSLLHKGDLLSIDFSLQNTKVIPVKLPLNIYYEDADLLIVDKPSGMLVHPTGNNLTNTLANAVLYHYAEHNITSDFHPVTRLDKDTSGLVLIAKHPIVQYYFTGSKAMFTKEYTALVHGKVPIPSAKINLPIGRKPGSIIERMVRDDGQTAVTWYQVLKIYRNATLLQITLGTGRTHQIRVHMSHIGHPLIGDTLYGGKADFLTRQALHASQLTFIHPATKKQISIRSNLPLDIQTTIANLIPENIVY